MKGPISQWSCGSPPEVHSGRKHGTHSDTASQPRTHACVEHRQRPAAYATERLRFKASAPMRAASEAMVGGHEACRSPADSSSKEGSVVAVSPGKLSTASSAGNVEPMECLGMAPLTMRFYESGTDPHPVRWDRWLVCRRWPTEPVWPQAVAERARIPDPRTRTSCVAITCGL